MKRTLWLSVLAGSMGVMNVAIATDDQPGSAAPEAAAPVATPVDTGAEPFKWSSAETENVGKMLVGTWKTSEPVKQGDGAASTDVVMNFVTVKVKGLADTLYVETARADALNKPYRQAIFQVFKYKGALRLRTFEFKTAGIGPALVALHQAPELFPELKSDDLIATLDLDIKPDGKGFSGKTAHPYPTNVGGAFEMTSELHIGADSIESADRGFNADGKIAWGSEAGGKYVFKRAASPYKVQKLEGGLVAIDFVEGTEGEPITAGDKIAAHYTGWNKLGGKFDSSIDRGQPLVFTQGQLIAGWNVGLLGAKKGSVRRLVIPSAMGYGEQGRPPFIPANSTLYFDVEIKSVEKPVPPPPADAPSGPTDQPVGQPGQPQQPTGQPQPK